MNYLNPKLQKFDPAEATRGVHVSAFNDTIKVADSFNTMAKETPIIETTNTIKKYLDTYPQANVMTSFFDDNRTKKKTIRLALLIDPQGKGNSQDLVAVDATNFTSLPTSAIDPKNPKRVEILTNYLNSHPNAQFVEMTGWGEYSTGLDDYIESLETQLENEIDVCNNLDDMEEDEIQEYIACAQQTVDHITSKLDVLNLSRDALINAVYQQIEKYKGNTLTPDELNTLDNFGGIEL